MHQGLSRDRAVARHTAASDFGGIDSYSSHLQVALLHAYRPHLCLTVFRLNFSLRHDHSLLLSVSCVLLHIASSLSMHLPFTPNHVQLISACYPPNAALPTSGPEYRPNSQELSRMTYYASNRPGKINKLASELEKRVKLDSRKAKAGNLRARAYVFNMAISVYCSEQFFEALS